MVACCLAFKITIDAAEPRAWEERRRRGVSPGLAGRRDGVSCAQSERNAIYEEAVKRIAVAGLVCACACSRADVTGRRRSRHVRAGTFCKSRAVACACGWQRTSNGSTIVVWGRRRGGAGPVRRHARARSRRQLGASVAVAVDDWRQGVNLVVRGEDLLDSTGRQIQLARLLGRREPPAFLHHPLIMKSETQKLSKSDGDTGIRDLRAKGWSASQVLAAIPRELRP